MCCHCFLILFAAKTAAGILGAHGHTMWLYYSPKYHQRAEEMRAALASNDGCISLTSHALPTPEVPDGITTYKVCMQQYLLAQSA
jgi:hypothetical protein